MKNIMPIAAAAVLLISGCAKEHAEEPAGSEMQMSGTQKMKSLDGVQQINFTVSNLFPEGVVSTFSIIVFM